MKSVESILQDHEGVDAAIASKSMIADVLQRQQLVRDELQQVVDAASDRITEALEAHLGKILPEFSAQATTLYSVVVKALEAQKEELRQQQDAFEARIAAMEQRLGVA